MQSEDPHTLAEQQPSLIRLSGWGGRHSWVRGLGLVALTVLVFFVLFRQIDVRELSTQLCLIPWQIWLVTFLLTFSFPLLSALRWHFVLRSMGFDISVKRCLLIIIGVWPLSAISPSKAGDLLKAVGLRREIAPAVVAGSVLAERTLDLLILAFFALIGGFAFHNITIAGIAAIVVLGITAGVFILRQEFKLPFGKKYQHKLEQLLHAMCVLTKSRDLFILIVMLTVANWLASIVQTKLLFDGVGANVEFGFTAAALPVAIFFGLLPVTFAGMGTRDGAMLILFAQLASPAQILTVSLLYTFFGYWFLAVVGIPFMRQALDW